MTLALESSRTHAESAKGDNLVTETRDQADAGAFGGAQGVDHILGETFADTNNPGNKNKKKKKKKKSNPARETEDSEASMTQGTQQDPAAEAVVITEDAEDALTAPSTVEVEAEVIDFEIAEDIPALETFQDKEHIDDNDGNDDSDDNDGNDDNVDDNDGEPAEAVVKAGDQAPHPVGHAVEAVTMNPQDTNAPPEPELNCPEQETVARRTCVVVPSPEQSPLPSPEPVSNRKTTILGTNAASTPISASMDSRKAWCLDASAMPVKKASVVDREIPYDKLLKMTVENCEGIEWERREEYLSEDEFEKVFGVKRDAFDKLAAWRQLNMKKKVGLF